MSSAYRSLVRLPLEIFEKLQFSVGDVLDDGEEDENNNATALDTISLRSAICNKLRKPPKKLSDHPITNVGCFLKLPSSTLVRLLDPLLTYAECETLRLRICSHCTPPPTSVLSLLRNKNAPSLSTGIPALDACLKGGFRLGTLSEVVGSAGVGKTQLAMQLCIQAAAQSRFGAVYIDTEKKLSLPRLREIATARIALTSSKTTTMIQHEDMEHVWDSGAPQSPSRQDGPITPHQILNNITVHSPSSTKELLSVIQSIEEEILLRNDEAILNPGNQFPVRVLIIDSIAGPTRRDLDQAPQRVALLVHMAQLLKRLADQLNLCVITINQVTSHNNHVPALGETWHHCLSTRLLMENMNSINNVKRRASVVKSNVAGNTSMEYEISTHGLMESSYYVATIPQGPMVTW